MPATQNPVTLDTRANCRKHAIRAELRSITHHSGNHTKARWAASAVVPTTNSTPTAPAPDRALAPRPASRAAPTAGSEHPRLCAGTGK
ncbi:MAG: hypothetical protein RML57_09065 [Acidobacteriota bacterium]|nr:hypothetical protein [Acidobacteriota bacterium]